MRPNEGGFLSLPSCSHHRVFGHISFRSDWELVKVDFRPSFSRQCGEEDYSSWDLSNLQVGRDEAGIGQVGCTLQVQAHSACQSPPLQGRRAPPCLQEAFRESPAPLDIQASCGLF